MTDTAHNTTAQEWASLSGRLEELNLALTQAPAQDVDRFEREIAALQDELLDTPAPSLVAVQQKLKIMWEGKLLDLDRPSEERRLVLEDLESLLRAQHELLGA